MSYYRIISLVPSLTELIIDLGVGSKLVGRTKFCIHPQEGIKDIPTIGGTKNPNYERIIKLQPDYIIANHEENRKEDIEFLREHTKVNVTKIDSILDALATIQELGDEFQLSEMALEFIHHIKLLLSQTPNKDSLRVAYFIWKDPWMVAASETYIDSVLQHYNLKNVFENETRYPEIDLDDLKNRNPELILLSSEPYPFKEKHLQEIQNACPDAKVELINGEWFSWYGSGMIKAFRNLNSWRNTLRINK